MPILPVKCARVKPGDKFGLLTAIGVPFCVRIGGLRFPYVVLECKCGTVKAVRAYDLNSRESCGCIRLEKTRKHGEATSRLYVMWRAMRIRCQDPTDREFERYGGAGILVCDEWLVYENFRDWALAHGYADDLTIDRIKGQLGYSPDNCRFATRKQQAQNRRRRVTSGSPYKSVHQRSSGRWRASIFANGKRVNLGHFATAEAAALAYDKAAKQYFGDHASLNFPEAQT